MSNLFEGTGNIGKAPELRYANINGESRPVLNFTVFVDDYKKDPRSGELTQTEKSFWLRCAIWGERAERAAKLLRVGARVLVKGALVLGRPWTDNEGEQHPGALELEAEDVFISLARVESISWRERAEQPNAA